MHGSVHPREVGAPQGPRVARDGVRKKHINNNNSNNSNNRRLVTLAEHTSDHGKQTNSIVH